MLFFLFLGQKKCIKRYQECSEEKMSTVVNSFHSNTLQILHALLSIRNKEKFSHFKKKKIPGIIMIETFPCFECEAYI